MPGEEDGMRACLVFQLLVGGKALNLLRGLENQGSRPFQGLTNGVSRVSLGRSGPQQETRGAADWRP